MTETELDPQKLRNMACQKNSNITYTEVVVIGNGPSGICTSFMLSGNWPYYVGKSHSNEYLHQRLMDEADKSIVEQDLEYLSEGLEGRSPNPVALLFDALTHPDADLGIDTGSLLEWRHDPSRHIPHVVLGKGPVGGAWQMMDGEMQTLSLGNWMQLPDEPFKPWIQRRHAGTAESGGNDMNNRASIQDVRTYYEEYVKSKKIRENFVCDTVVTSVERVLDVCHRIDDESGEQLPCSNKHHDGMFKWEVRGYRQIANPGSAKKTQKEFSYRCLHVILATGTYDLPNRLRVTGEHLPYVMYTLSDMEKRISSGKIHPNSDPVLIIGAGLSAADAILCARAYGIPVIHLFRRRADDPQVIFGKLPKALYPEYHRVHRMMKGLEEEDGYKFFAQHDIREFMEDGKVILRHQKSGRDTIINVSGAVVQIGARPDLSYLPQSGRNLGIIPDRPVDSKANPIDINPYTYQSLHEAGIFAVGPLVGDNFVRFLRGGALGITAHLWRKRTHNL